MRCRTIGALLLGLITVWTLLPGAATAAAAGLPRLVGWTVAGYGGSVGAGTDERRLLPTATDMSGALAGRTVTAVSTGGSAATTCAVADGRGYCWGGAASLMGRPGGPVNRPQPLPTGAMGGRGVTAISLGGHQACAIASGRAFCWGDSNVGGLGNGLTRGGILYAPVAVATDGVLAGRTVTAISSGWDHTCAVADGKAYCWGLNSSGQLGNGTTVTAAVPVAVDASGVLAGKRVTAVAAGQRHTCALADGQVFCWGYGVNGQLGDGTGTSRLRPVTVTGLPAAATLLSASADGQNSCAVANGAVQCWGSSQPSGMTTRATPLPAGSLAGRRVTALDLGSGHACAVAAGGVHCWGDWPGLGAGVTTDQRAPIAVTGGALAGRTATAVSVSGPTTMVVTTG